MLFLGHVTDLVDEAPFTYSYQRERVVLLHSIDHALD